MNPPPWGEWREAADLGLAYAAWVLGWLEPQDATWVAAAALERGIDTHEIRITAGMIKPDRREVGETIDTAFRQILGNPMDWSVAVTLMLRYQLARVLEGDDETLWQAASTGAWINRHASEYDISQLPQTSKKWVVYLRDTKYAIEDVHEWAGPSAPLSRHDEGEKWRRRIWAELRQWARREYRNSDSK